MSIATATDRPASNTSDIPDRLWGKPDLMRFFGVTRSTLDAWMKAGRIPRGRRFGRFLRWDPRVIQRLAGLDDIGNETATDPQ